MSYSYRLPRKYRYRGGSDNRGMAVGAVIVAVAVLGTAQHGKAAACHPRRGGNPRASAPVAMAGRELRRPWHNSDGCRSASTATMAATVAMANPVATRVASTPTRARITTDDGRGILADQLRYFPVARYYDPIGNARAAMQISHDGTDGPLG